LEIASASSAAGESAGRPADGTALGVAASVVAPIGTLVVFAADGGVVPLGTVGTTVDPA
jgi:hypothetical protein